MVPAEHRQQLANIGGRDGISSGLRLAVAAGLAALDGQSPSLQAAVDHLDHLADQLASVSGRRTPSGAWWAPTQASAPEPDQLDPVGAVVATPNGVVLIAADAVLAVDLQVGLVSAIEDGEEQAVPADVQALAAPIALVLPSLIGLSSAGPGQRELGCGLAIERTAADLVAITLGSLGPLVPADVAWQWAAEMSALLSRSLSRSVRLRSELERQLAEVA